MTDQATGLLNRTAYNAFLLQNRSHTLPLACCAHIDVNGLHELNNRMGHAAGDRMLQRVADCLREQFAPECIYRIGGDEFVMLTAEGLSRTDCGQKIRQVQKDLAQDGYSIAYGIAVREQEKGLDRVVEEADEAMLENKKQYYAARTQRAPR